MWSREILKSNAKIALTGRYWRAFVVALLVSLLSGLANLGNTLSRLADTYESFWGIWGAHDLENFSTHVHFMNWLDAWTVALALFGFLLAIYLFSTVRERLEFADYPKAFEGFPIALITAGLIALAFMGFSGLQVWPM